MKPLILVVTRRCNLRCGYCDVDKQNISMNRTVARKATVLYIGWAKKNKKKKLLIRFFGGEPLMNFAVVRDVVAYAKQRAKREKMEVEFDLTTNGMFIDDAVMDFFKKTSEMRVIISLDGDARTQNVNRKMNGSKTDSYKNILIYKDRLISLPNVTVNMVIAPNQVLSFYENFIHNYQLGFMRFNFLPAYFVIWKKNELRSLIAKFRKIAHFLHDHDDISIKNREIFSELPFFNSGFVIDCNGDLFNTNSILSKHYMHLRSDLTIGNIIKRRKKNVLNFSKNNDIVSLLQGAVDGRFFYSSLKVDKILNHFVEGISK